jgi:hypothetical protein
MFEMLGWRVRWLFLNWRLNLVLRLARYLKLTRHRTAVRSAST